MRNIDRTWIKCCTARVASVPSNLLIQNHNRLCHLRSDSIEDDSMGKCPYCICSRCTPPTVDLGNQHRHQCNLCCIDVVCSRVHRFRSHKSSNNSCKVATFLQFHFVNIQHSVGYCNECTLETLSSNYNFFPRTFCTRPIAPHIHLVHLGTNLLCNLVDNFHRAK